MATIQDELSEKRSLSKHKKVAGLSPAFLKTAQRLEVADNKVLLDRNNPDHVRWAADEEAK